jgi:acyl carrier protein
MTSHKLGLREELRNFVTENFLFGQVDATFGDRDSFLEAGIIDSTGVLELTHFLENHFGLAVADEELIPDNLDSINNLVRFIQAKQSKAA